MIQLQDAKFKVVYQIWIDLKIAKNIELGDLAAESWPLPGCLVIASDSLVVNASASHFRRGISSAGCSFK